MKRRIPEKLKRIAAVREQQAQQDVNQKAREVEDSKDNLAAIEAQHTASEAQLVEGVTQLDGAALQLLAMGRAVHRNRRADAEQAVRARQDELEESRAAHHQRRLEHHYKDKLYERFKDSDLDEERTREQKAVDDSTTSRYGKPGDN